MINRREFLGITAGAGVSLALTPELLRAFQRGLLVQRAIPSSGEMLPVISFSPRPTAVPGPGPIPSLPSDLPAAREVLRAFLDNGGKVVDVMHGGPVGENAGRTAANELGIQDKFWWTTPLNGPPPAPPDVPPPPKAAATAVRAQIETKLANFKVPSIDLVLTGAYGATKDPTYLGVLREMKKEGRIRYIGVHHLPTPPNYTRAPAFGDLEAVMRNEPIDFVATDYNLGDRRVEQEILPLAQERKIAFMAYFTFDRGRLFKRASGTPLPEWAAEFDARTWAQFFIKYVVSHPAVTMARTGTTRPRTCSTTSAAASAACRTRRRGSGWRRSWIHSRPGSEAHHEK
jgi:aryl-alcohol dehydrogenase-like predicted oxidoreductase